jgi:hypothetical protein
MAKEYSGVATLDNEVKLRVTFMATVWHNAAARKNEVDIHGQVAYTLDGIDVDEEYLEATLGVATAASAIERAMDSALEHSHA